MIVENDENDDEPDIEELGSALHGRRRRGRAVLLFGRAERVSQVVRRASKREKLDAPRRYEMTVLSTFYKGFVLAEDGRSIQALCVGLDTNVHAATPGHATAAMQPDDQWVPADIRHITKVAAFRPAPAAVVGADPNVLVDVEAAPGDRADAVLAGLFPDPPVRLNASLSFFFPTSYAATLALVPGRVGPEVPTADDAFVGQDQRRLGPRGKFHVPVFAAERIIEKRAQENGGKRQHVNRPGEHELCLIP